MFWNLGIIQILYNIFQSFSKSDIRYDKLKDFMINEFIEKLLILASRKNPLLHPFLQVIIV